MKKTIRGVFLNLEDSTFIATNGEINLFFSSSARLGKFLVGYVENRQKSNKKLEAIIGENLFSYNPVFDVSFYEHCENKGHFCLLDGKPITKEELENYALKCVVDHKSFEFKGVTEPEEINKIRSVMK
jgi:hypothetical protein